MMWQVPGPTAGDTRSLAAVPAPTSPPIALRITGEAERALRQGHPWLFEQAIQRQSREGRPGDLAVVFDRKGRFLAIGLYDPDQAIRVRVLQHRHPATIDRAWFGERLATAVQRRAPLAGTGTTGYRLVHGENDGMPGLVIDRYDQVLVVKLYTAAWLPHLAPVLDGLALLVLHPAVVLRLSRAVRDRTAHLHGLADGQLLAGSLPRPPILFSENGLRFEVDPVAGQKTGFFLDQRDNRARVESLAGGRQVLNVFAYSGGFSLYAARGGAPQVTSVDAGQPALDAARRNFGLNHDHPAVAMARHHCLQGDAFETLERLCRAGHRFDMVILDPPAFAHRRAQEQRALAAYRRLTRLGLGVLRPGAILVQASCSSRIGREAFFEAVHATARDRGRPLREIERTGHPLDHPIGFPEGAYLKCLFAFAD